MKHCNFSRPPITTRIAFREKAATLIGVGIYAIAACGHAHSTQYAAPQAAMPITLKPELAPPSGDTMTPPVRDFWSRLQKIIDFSDLSDFNSIVEILQLTTEKNPKIDGDRPGDAHAPINVNDPYAQHRGGINGEVLIVTATYGIGL